MLVLARKCGEEIHVGGSVVIRVLSIQGRKVRLGVEAPAAVPVHRGEGARPGADLRRRRPEPGAG